MSIRVLAFLSLIAAVAPVHASGPLCRPRAPGLFPVVQPTRAIAKARSPEVVVGQQRTFWAWDFAVMPPGFRRVTATCRAVGARGLVYVDDAEWGTHFSQADLDAVTERFERSTPAGSLDPKSGIADVVGRTFAPLPVGLNGDARVVLFFTAFASFNGTSFDGYFNAFDTLTEAEAATQQQHSNECDVLYLNTRGNPISSDYMLGVLSHELAHLVCHPFSAERVSWIDESLGEASMIACGYPVDVQHLGRFCAKPETPLVTDSYVSYGACFLFGTYLLEQLGPDGIAKIVRDPAHGEAGLAATLEAAHRGPFAAFHRDWAVANLLAHASPADPRWAYRAFAVPALTLRHAAALPAEDAGDLAPYRLRYLALPARAGVSMTLEPSTSTARLAAVAGATPANLLSAAGNATVPAGADPVLVLLGDTKCGYRLELTPAR